jgi:hypothetical protein
MALFGKFWDRIAPASKPRHADGAQPTSIDDYLNGEVRAGDPGLAVAVVKSGAVVAAAGFGLADLRTKVAITPETIFHLDSCGKQFTAMGNPHARRSGQTSSWTTRSAVIFPRSRASVRRRSGGCSITPPEFVTLRRGGDQGRAGALRGRPMPTSSPSTPISAAP